jgi:hypothetical protein
VTREDLTPYPKSLKVAEESAREYHSRSLPGDTLLYPYFLDRLGTLVEQPRPPRGEALLLLLNGYLRDWHGMRRVLGADYPEGPDYVRIGLEKAIGGHWGEIRKLRMLSLEVGLSDSNSELLARLFDGLLRDWTGINRINSRSYKSPVAVGKLLHILLPKLGVIWDNEYVLDRWFESSDGSRLGFKPDGSGYARYVAFKAEQLRRLSEAGGKSPPGTARIIERRHAREVRRLIPDMADIRIEPITKILDELNYL